MLGYSIEFLGHRE